MSDNSNKNNDFRHYSWIIIPVIIEIIVIITCIFGYFFLNNNHMNKIYYGVRLSAEITATFGLGSVIIGALTYRNTKEQQQRNKDSAKLTRTINVIRAFKTKISDEMDQSEQDVEDRKNLDQTKSNILKHQLTSKDMKKYGITPNDIKNMTFTDLNKSTQKEIERYNRFNNVIDTINNIEQWSLYVDEGMVYYILVYRETHHDYIQFIDEFRDVLEETTSPDDKYQACYDVYHKMKVSEKNAKQKQKENN